MKQASNATQSEINHFCEAASAVYFTVAASHAAQTGEMLLLPDLMEPTRPIPCIHHFSPDLITEAERFLLRLGMIAKRPT